MSEISEVGVLYTEHSALIAMTPVLSLWSYETRVRERHRRRVTPTADGNREYWLDRSDPLLNTILPGTGVSLVLNLADDWAVGRSLATSARLPRACVVGPVTQPQIVRMGRSVRAVGAVVSTTLTPNILGVPASELTDQIVPLQDLWSGDDVEKLSAALSCHDIRSGASVLKDKLMVRASRPNSRETIEETAARLIKRYGGRVSIDQISKSHGLSRQQFARRFYASAGLSPKLFARITRFQTLVRTLLSRDVSEWVSVAPAVGFYDQAHMINEFRTFAGSPPTVFFRPHQCNVDPRTIQTRGRPSEWLDRTAVAHRESLTLSPR